MTGVFCYRNLNRKGVVWSVRSNRSGLVIRRTKFVVLKDVTLKVSAAGRARVLKQKRKNVHAGAVGTLVQNRYDFQDTVAGQLSWIRVYYNPLIAGHFTDSRGKKVSRAKYVVLRHDGAWASGVSSGDWG